MMMGLGLVLLLAPEALNSPLAALALIAAALGATVLFGWLVAHAGRSAPGRDRGITH